MMLIAHADPQVFKLGFGIFLLVFPVVLYFQRAPMAFGFGGKPADTLIGFFGGILGGLAGLSGPLPILWASVRGWGKTERRGIFQIFNWTILLTALVLQIGSGLVKMDVIWLALLAFPGTVLGAWLGTRVYHALSDRNFRDVVLGPVVSVRRDAGVEQHRHALAHCDRQTPAWPPCAMPQGCTLRVRIRYLCAMTSPSLSQQSSSALSREKLGLLLGFVGMAIFGGTCRRRGSRSRRSTRSRSPRCAPRSPGCARWRC